MAAGRIHVDAHTLRQLRRILDRTITVLSDSEMDAAALYLSLNERWNDRSYRMVGEVLSSVINDERRAVAELEALAPQIDKLIEQVDTYDSFSFDNPSGTNAAISRVYGTSPACLSEWPITASSHSAEEDAALVNPGYNSESWGRSYNCQRCAPTYEMRRRGYDVIASARPPSYLYDNLSFHPEDAWQHPEVVSCSGTGRRDVIEHLLASGPGSRAEIVVFFAHGGHAFVAENCEGEVRFLDPQTGSSDVDWYFDSVIPNRTRFWRTDNLIPSDEIATCCYAREGTQ